MCKNITIIPKKSQKKYLSLFFLLLLVSVIPMDGVVASASSQKFTMDLQMEQESFETILKEIKRKSRYKVLYPSDLFDGLPKMSIDVKDASISDILDELIVPF